MSNNKQVPEGKDPELWKIARKRAGFKTHAIVYVIVNIFLWAMWYFNEKNYAEDGIDLRNGHIMTTIGWGVGLAFHYMSAYMNKGVNSIESEYEKLKNKQQ